MLADQIIGFVSRWTDTVGWYFNMNSYSRNFITILFFGVIFLAVFFWWFVGGWFY